MKELKELSQFIAGFRLDDAGDAVSQAAIQCTLDSVGAALGGRLNPMFSSIRDCYLTCDGTAGKNVSLWGSSSCAPLRTAVFLNAMMGHVLELDDVHTKSKTHIGTVVIPAAWGLAEYLQASGRSFLEAVICGYETMARIGMGFGVSSHRNKGWHVTGTAGTFGAAAACAKLLGFDEEQILSAFGLAGTQSCTTWAFLSDGATNKVLHPARAAASGLEACILTLAGMRGSSHILDAEDGGIFPMMSDGYDYSLISRLLGEEYEILNVDKKPYPCCRSTHCAIDAALRIRNAHHPDWSRIRSVSVKTYLVGYKQCGLTESSLRPKVPTDAKFSTPYTVACALKNGRVGLSDFLPEAISSPELQALSRKVSVSEETSFTDAYPHHWGCEMTVCTEDGNSYTEYVRDASGSVYSPLSSRQLLDKMQACCGDYSPLWLKSITDSLENIVSLPFLPSLNPEGHGL